ncbi:MAG TPA: carbohydrate-binding protein, partial [Polyangia bacterium]|nr:carbohydrate-binding protein [Polyangia bacterium]
LPAGMTLVKQDQNGVSYVFPGSIGLAPGWFRGVCDDACQERITACLMSLTNSGGRHVAVELVTAAAGMTMIGPGGDDVEYPNQEGAVFGNLFVSPPQMFTCTGTESTSAEQVKRYCIDGTPCDLFTKVGSCAAACTQSCTVGPGGKKVCSAKSCKDPTGKSWANPITVFLHNKMEANNFDGQSGVGTAGLASSGLITGLDNGDWVQMNDVQFGTVAGSVKSVHATLATPNSATASGNFIDVRVGSATGTLLGSLPVRATANGSSYVVQSAAINTAGLTGRHPVFFGFRGGSNVAFISYFELK